MKVGILAGGKGTRLAEETDLRPKPMVEIGGRPLLWHIIRHYVAHGFSEFTIAAGYKGELIADYFGEQRLPEIELADCSIDVIDTGLDTQTGGRIKRLAPHLGNDTFMLTWGDGVSDVDLQQLAAFHHQHGRQATVTAVRPPVRFGRLTMEGDRVTSFREKPRDAEGWINGAFFVLAPSVLELISDDATQWEREPLETLASQGELMAYRHDGFWQCMDTIHDQRILTEYWEMGNIPWKTWS